MVTGNSELLVSLFSIPLTSANRITAVPERSGETSSRGATHSSTKNGIIARRRLRKPLLARRAVQDSHAGIGDHGRELSRDIRTNLFVRLFVNQERRSNDLMQQTRHVPFL